MDILHVGVVESDAHAFESVGEVDGIGQSGYLEIEGISYSVIGHGLLDGGDKILCGERG